MAGVLASSSYNHLLHHFFKEKCISKCSQPLTGGGYVSCPGQISKTRYRQSSCLNVFSWGSTLCLWVFFSSQPITTHLVRFFWFHLFCFVSPRLQSSSWFILRRLPLLHPQSTHYLTTYWASHLDFFLLHFFCGVWSLKANFPAACFYFPEPSNTIPLKLTSLED